MITLFVVGTYLMIGAFIAVFGWSRSDKDEGLADELLVNTLTFLSVMIFWPRIFVIFARIVRKRLSEPRK